MIVRRVLPFALALSLVGCSSTEEKPDEAVTQPAPAEEQPPASADEPAEQPAAEPAGPVYTAAAAPGDDHPISVGYAHFNDGAFDKAADMFADDATWRSTFRPAPFEGKEAIKGALSGWGPLSPAAGARRVFAVGTPEGEVVVVEGVLAGKHTGEYMGQKATNKKFSVPYAHIAWMNPEGKVRKYLAVFNGMAVPSQLGLMQTGMDFPAATMPLSESEVVVGEFNQARADAYRAMLDTMQKGEQPDMGAMLADDIVVRYHHTGRSVSGKDAVMTAQTEGMKAFSDFNFDDITVLAVGDYVVAFGTEKAKMVGDMGPMKATNEMVSTTKVEVVKFAGDKIVGIDVYRDPMELALVTGNAPKTSMR